MWGEQKEGLAHGNCEHSTLNGYEMPKCNLGVMNEGMRDTIPRKGRKSKRNSSLMTRALDKEDSDGIRKIAVQNSQRSANKVPR